MTTVLDQSLASGLLYGALPKMRPHAAQVDREPVDSNAARCRDWIEGDLAVWRPDPTQGTVDVLVRAVDRPTGTAEVLVLTPHIAETNQDLVAPLDELQIKGRSDVPPRADFRVGDVVTWAMGNRDVVECMIVESPPSHRDWVSVEVDETHAVGLRQAGRYNPHRASIRLA